MIAGTKAESVTVIEQIPLKKQKSGYRDHLRTAETWDCAKMFP
jgi:hypothetical protein